MPRGTIPVLPRRSKSNLPDGDDPEDEEKAGKEMGRTNKVMVKEEDGTGGNLRTTRSKVDIKAEGESRKTRGKVAVKEEEDTGSSRGRTRGKVSVKEEEEEEDTGSSRGRTRGKVAVKEEEEDTGSSSKRTRGKVAVKEEEDDTGSSSKRTRGKVAVKEEDTSGPGVDEMEEDDDSDNSDVERHRSDRTYEASYPKDLEKNVIAYLNKIFAKKKGQDIPWRLSENVLLSITGSKIRTANPTEGHWSRGAVVQKPPRFPGMEITKIPTDIRERLALNHGHYFGYYHYNDRVDGPWKDRDLPCMFGIERAERGTYRWTGSRGRMQGNDFLFCNVCSAIWEAKPGENGWWKHGILPWNESPRPRSEGCPVCGCKNLEKQTNFLRSTTWVGF